MAKTGYIEESEVSKEVLNNSVSINEQETVIVFMRDTAEAEISTSDSTMKTKFDRLCQTSDMWECTEDNGRYKFYKVKDKTLISYRNKKKEMSEEQKEAASERFKKLRAEGKLKNN